MRRPQLPLAEDVVVVVVHVAVKIEVIVPVRGDRERKDDGGDEEEGLDLLPEIPAEVSAGAELNDEGSSSSSSGGGNSNDRGKEVTIKGSWTSRPVFEEEDDTANDDEEEVQERGLYPRGTWSHVPNSFLKQDAYSVPKKLRRPRRSLTHVPRAGDHKSKVGVLDTVWEDENTC